MSALAEGEEEDNEINDLDDLQDIDDIEKVKKVCCKLQKEKKEEEIYVRNLLRKLNKLKTDLDARTEEVEKFQRSLEREQHKGIDVDENIRRERNDKASAQENRIRDKLSDVLFAKPPSSTSGGQDDSGFELDTVVVSYQPPGGTKEYNLQFRVDTQTSVQELRASACRYWGQSKDEYVLKTMAGFKCQDDILLSACFRQGELARLRLESKDCNPCEKPTDDEQKAIAPIAKGRKASKKKLKNDGFDSTVVDGLRKQQDSHNKDMSQMGGTYFLLRKRDQKPPEHRTKITVRDMIIYSILTFLTFYSYHLRRPWSNNYWLIRGFEDHLSQRKLVGNRRMPRFQDVVDHTDVVDWLNYTFADVFYGQERTLKLADYNALIGYVTLRVQLVEDLEDPLEACDQNRAVVAQLSKFGAHCKAIEVTERWQRTSNFSSRLDHDSSLAMYWETAGASSVGEAAAQLHGPSKPYEWQSSEHMSDVHGILSYTGDLQKYDSSGYMAEYRMGVSGDLADSFRQDLAEFVRHGWLGELTRVLFIEFQAYNFDYDMWVHANLIFELPDHGRVLPKMWLVPFQPKILETRSELWVTYMDYTRVVIAIYILIFVGQHERTHKIYNHQAGCWYHVSLNGICDLGAVVCIAIGMFGRNLYLNGMSTQEWMVHVADLAGRQGFHSLQRQAKTYEAIMSVEGLLMVFLMYRMISFFRINRTIYLLWHTLGIACKGVLFFSLLLMPAVGGFIFLLHLVYGPYTATYSSFSGATMSVYSLLTGTLEMDALVLQDPVWALLILSFFYIIVHFILLNVFATIVVDAYYVAHVVDGGPGESFSWRKWAVPTILRSIVMMLVSDKGTEAT